MTENLNLQDFTYTDDPKGNFILEDIYSKIKAIEDAVKENEYTEDQVGFYFASRKVEMTLEDTANLKKALLEEKVIGEEDKVFLEMAEEPCSDIKAVCNDYRIRPDLADSFLSAVEEADEYYKVNADGFYARSGYLWSDCRLICKDGEYVLLDFYICD